MWRDKRLSASSVLILEYFLCDKEVNVICKCIKILDQFEKFKKDLIPGKRD